MLLNTTTTTYTRGMSPVLKVQGTEWMGAVNEPYITQQHECMVSTPPARLRPQPRNTSIATVDSWQAIAVALSRYCPSHPP
jgi:hypothetical protein